MTEKKNPAETLRKRRIDRLFEIADRLAVLPGPPMTEAEVEAEIQAVRKLRAARTAPKHRR